jgi:hypothetical protein
MAVLDKRDTAITEGSVVDSALDFVLLCGVTADGATLTTGTDFAGQTVSSNALAVVFGYLKDLQIVHAKPSAQTTSLGGTVVANIAQPASCYITGTIIGSDLVIQKILNSGDQGYHVAAIVQEPASTPGSYMKKLFHLGKFEKSLSTEFTEGGQIMYKFRIDFIELETATTDTNKIGDKYYATSIITSKVSTGALYSDFTPA